MDGPLIVEVLDRRDRVVQRQRLERFPAVVGRGWSSDVLLDDPHVCAAHLRIAADEDGRLVAEDLGSVNGTHAGTPPHQVSRLAITPGLTLRVGRAQLRFHAADEPVAPALLDVEETSRFQRRGVALGVCVVAFALTATDAYLSAYQPEFFAPSVYGILLLALLVAVWSTAWAFVNRVVAHEWRLLAHTATVCAFGIGLFVLGLATEYWSFIFPASRAVDVVGALVTVALLAALLDGHLSLMSAAAPGRRRIAAFVLALSAVGTLELLDRLEDNLFSTRMEFASSLKPVPAHWLPTESIDQFTDQLSQVRDEVDELAKRP